MSPNEKTLSRSISATVENGKKLLEDATLLFDWERYSTSLALSVLAQEEFSKAFLLQLVADGALPWIPEVHRSMAVHQCKHLLGLVMEWLSPWDKALDQSAERARWREERIAWLRRQIDRNTQGILLPDENDPEPTEPGVSFTSDVAKALNIYRHEEIERMRSGEAWKDAQWATGNARKIANGSRDKKKQTGFYVDITKTGEIGTHPGQITREEASEEIERAKRLSEGPSTLSHEYQKLKEFLPLVFYNLRNDIADQAIELLPS